MGQVVLTQGFRACFVRWRCTTHTSSGSTSRRPQAPTTAMSAEEIPLAGVDRWVERSRWVGHRKESWLERTINAAAGGVEHFYVIRRPCSPGERPCGQARGALSNRRLSCQPVRSIAPFADATVSATKTLLPAHREDSLTALKTVSHRRVLRLNIHTRPDESLAPRMVSPQHQMMHLCLACCRGEVDGGWCCQGRGWSGSA